MAPVTELPTEPHRKIAGNRSGVHPRAWEKAGKDERVIAKLTRGLASMEEFGRTNDDDDRRREATGLNELGTGTFKARPNAAENVPHCPVQMGEGSG